MAVQGAHIASKNFGVENNGFISVDSCYKHYTSQLWSTGFLHKFSNDFLWQGHNRVSTNVVQNPPQYGRLNHINIKHFLHRLQAKWMSWLWWDKVKHGLSLHGRLLHIPASVFAGMTGCAEHILMYIPAFYAMSALLSRITYGWLSCSLKLTNVWLT